MVLLSFPWRAPSLQCRAPSTFTDVRRAILSRVPLCCQSTTPCKCGCLVPGFAPFSRARALFRPRRASGTFSRFPVFCPCTTPCTSGCLVHGFAQLSMARAQFRPRRASVTFFPCPRFLPLYSSVYEWVPRTWFCPVFHGTRPVSSPTGVGHFFPCTRFFARVRVGASYMVLPSFAWRASSFVHGGSRALCYRVLCSRVPVLNAFGICTRHWPYWVIAYVLQGTLPFLLPMT
jgi:hypothetical protein